MLLAGIRETPTTRDEKDQNDRSARRSFFQQTMNYHDTLID